ncbi:LamG-like jellyroll fold domain-containing protein [Curvibacter sp. APW13]|uniref:DUF6701 domain-containing protein n=1 Tax=Curvibacter sp. APW13 TaxID=3077236 RepID=UPI0028DFEA0C|nr:DUF6701 domain-containing protein [Curvibacter sp. APW13]MDT8990216.1 LamG-like jellyroll fold domain-containing protein [Curvibacter sp. APW13]
MALSNNVTINASGTYTLTLNIAGNFASGTDPVIVGNISTGGSTVIGVNGNITGNITAAGSVDLGNNAVVTGNVTGSSITFGNSSTMVNGVCTPTYTQCSGLTLTKVADSSAGQLNSVVSFTIKAKNSSSSALSNVTITDALPASMSYSASAPTLGSVAVTGQTVTWTITSLPAGATAQLSLAVTLLTQGTQTNTVTAPNAPSASASVLVLGGAVTHYRMDEAVGTWNGSTGEVLDSGSTGLHGKRVLTGASSTTNTVVPSPTIASQKSSVSGSFCNAGRFDGNAVVQVPTSPLFNYTTKFSASAWIYMTGYPASGGLYSVLSNDVNYEFHINSSGKLYWWWNNGQNITSSSSIPLNTWTHVAITFSSATGAGRQKIYINGVQDATSGSWTGTLQQNSCNFYVGGDVATGSCSVISSRNFQGYIDETKLYNYELSASEVQADMNLGRNCSGTFDHIQIEHDGAASTCTPESVTLKACLNAACTSLYSGAVTVRLTPSGWTSGDTFTFSGGTTTRTLSQSSAGTVVLGVGSVSPTPDASASCYNSSTNTNSCSLTYTSASCAFDAVEVGANPKTNLYTKLAGTAFSVDIVAVNGTSVDTTSSAALTVDLVDTTSSACPTGTGLTSTQSVTLASGRKSASFTYAGAAKNVRVRMQQGSGTPACSTDNFAIRPTAFTVSSSNANADSTGANGTAAPKIKAGAAFTLTADTGTVGYGGTPTLDTTKASAHSGAEQTGTLAGSFTAAAASASGNGASGTAFTYSEVGYFRLAADGVVDSTFTAVDSAASDCIAGSSSNTLSGGKYGCNIGSTQSSYFGRFIPDHFITSVTAGCGAFTYAGQPLGLTVTAQNAANATTQNYSGSTWAKSVTVSDSGSGPTAIACVSGSSCTGAPVWTNATLLASTFSKGVATPAASASPAYAYQNTAVGATSSYAMAAPYTLGVRALDTDAVTSSGFSEGSTVIRSGRVRMRNAYGSERLSTGLSVPVAFEYYDAPAVATAGWRTGTDTCTTVASSQFAFVYPVDTKNGLAACRTAGGSVGAKPTPNLGLVQPVGNVTGWVDVTLNLGSAAAGSTCTTSNAATGYSASAATAGVPWLQYPWGGAANTNPSARATFGVYKSPLIYRRENY